MKEATITLPEGHKAANVRVEKNFLYYEVVPEEKQVEEIEAYIARNASGMLYLYNDGRPEKGQTVWYDTSIESPTRLNGNLFPSVKWEDAKPTKVRLKIETI